MKNIRKRLGVRQMTSKDKLLNLASKTTFVSSKVFYDELVAVHKIKETLTLDKPAYFGMCILDMSKTLMYNFHYNYIRKSYGEKALLLLSDTGSSIYEIQAEDFCKDFYNNREAFYNCDYSADSPFHFRNNNNKVIGKMEDEAAGCTII